MVCLYELKDINNVVNGKILNNNNKIINKFSIDSRNIENNTIFIPIIGKKYDGNDFILDAIKNGCNASLINSNYKNKNRVLKICKKKNISLIEVNNTLESLSLLAKNNRIKNKNTVVIGITGSNGKTTTKDLLYSILKDKYNVLKTEGNLNNHIGLPLTLLKLNKHDICILEMGMNHKGEINNLSNIANPDIAIITNIGTAHIGNLGSKEDILSAKLEIINGLKDNGILLINDEDEYLHDTNIENIKVNKYGYDDLEKFKRKNNNVYLKIDKIKIKLKIEGEYDILNAILGYHIAKLFNVNTNTLKKSLKRFKRPKMRMETYRLNDNIIIDDSYNANYDSMKNGIEYVLKTYSKKYKILLYLGDMLELGEWSKHYHKRIGKLINNSNIDVLYTTGNEIKYILEEIYKLFAFPHILHPWAAVTVPVDGLVPHGGGPNPQFSIAVQCPVHHHGLQSFGMGGHANELVFHSFEMTVFSWFDIFHNAS